MLAAFDRFVGLRHDPGTRIRVVREQLDRLDGHLPGTPLAEVVAACLQHFPNLGPEPERLQQRRVILAEIQRAHRNMEGAQPGWREGGPEEARNFFNALVALRRELGRSRRADPRLQDQRSISRRFWESLPGTHVADPNADWRIATRLEQEIDDFCFHLHIPSAGEVVQNLIDEGTDRYRERLRPVVAPAAREAAIAEAEGLRARIIEEQATRRADRLAQEDREAMIRSALIALAGATIAIHSPFYSRPRTFLTCATTTAIIAAWKPEANESLDLLRHELHHRTRRLVQDHFQDKVLACFLTLFPTLWLLAKLPVIGKAISAVTGLGSAVVAGSALWRFQRDNRVGPARLEPVDDAQPNRELTIKIAKLVASSAFLLLYPMTTNTHLAMGSAVAVVSLSATSRPTNAFFRSDRVHQMWRTFYTNGKVRKAAAILSILFSFGFILGYTSGRYLPGRMNVDLNRICSRIGSVLVTNQIVAIIGGAFAGHYLWEVQDDLFLRRGEQTEERRRANAEWTPLGWLDRYLGLDHRNHPAEVAE